MAEHLDFFPADLSVDQIRDIAHRAANENMAALARAYEIIAGSREAIKRADEILSKNRRGLVPRQLADPFVSFDSSSALVTASAES